MKQLTNEEKATVFAGYFNKHMIPENTRNQKVNGMVLMHIMNNAAIADEMKLLLTPLSSISDEHAIEIAQLCWLGGLGRNTDFKVIKRDDFAVWVEGYCRLGIKRYMCFNKYGGITTQSTFPADEKEPLSTLDHNIGSIQSSARDGAPYQMIFQYLKSKGYDVPLWFGIDHPCNGMTAIQLNIAIDKTKLT